MTEIMGNRRMKKQPGGDANTARWL